MIISPYCSWALSKMLQKPKTFYYDRSFRVMILAENFCVKVLKDSKDPLSYTEITERIIKRDGSVLKGKTPERTINRTLNQSIKKKISPFIKLKDGNFIINPDFDIDKYEEEGSYSLLNELNAKFASLIEKMEFDKIKRNFVVGEHKINIVAMHENNVLVFEYKENREKPSRE